MADDPIPWTHEVTGLRRLRRRQLQYFGHAPPEAYPDGHRVSRTARVLDLFIQLLLLVISFSAIFQLPFMRESTRGFIATLPYGLFFAAFFLAFTTWHQRRQREAADPEGPAAS